MESLTQTAPFGNARTETALQHWQAWVACAAVSFGLLMLAVMVWYDVLTLRQVLGILLLVSAAIVVLGATKDDAPPSPISLPTVEQSVMIETEAMYSYSHEAKQLNKIMATHGVGFKVREARLSGCDFSMRRVSSAAS